MREVEYDEYVPVQSSAIASVVYSNKNQELYVLFPGGRAAGYRRVDRETFDDFIRAYSVGSFYASEIKGQYSGINTEDITFVKSKDEVQVVERPEETEGNEYEVVFSVVMRENIVAKSLSDLESILNSHYPEADVLEVNKV